jgi:hypothetical protein
MTVRRASLQNLGEQYCSVKGGAEDQSPGYVAPDGIGSHGVYPVNFLINMERDPDFVVENAAGKQLGMHREAQAIDHKTALHFVITWLGTSLGDRKAIAAGHRVVVGAPASRWRC